MYDLTGQKFKMLTVIKQSDSKIANNQEIAWECQCECGKICIRKSSRLRNGDCKSCGCSRNFGHNRLTTREEAVKKATFDVWKACALYRNKVVELTHDEFWEIILQPCHFCGRSGMTKSCERKNRQKDYISPLVIYHNKIDRLDSNVGYIKSNSVSCCKHCNFAKNAMSVEEFREWINLVYRHFGVNNETISSCS